MNPICGMRIILIISTTLLLLLTGCRHTASDPAIRRAELLADSLPRQALTILDSIPEQNLSAHDLFLHRYLTIKAKDKLFITHTGDSLLRLALDYAENNPRSVNYPEVLYYAGRVYNDIGDYPTALEYYHNSLDQIPEDRNPRLRAKVLAYIGHIFSATCLYDESIDAFRKAIQCDSVCSDTLNLMYDYISLGNVYLKKDNYDSSEKCYREVMKLADAYPKIMAEQNLNIARVKYRKNRIDSAVMLINNIVYKVEPEIRNHALASAAEIYREANMPDSAYRYAMELISSKNNRDKVRGYNVLLSDVLKNKIPDDSVRSYIRKYTMNMNRLMKRNTETQIFINNSYYNYSVQQRERLDSEKKLSVSYFALLVAAMLILIVSGVLIYQKIKLKNRKIQTLEFQNEIATLRERLSHSLSEEKTDSTTDSTKEIILQKLNAEDIDKGQILEDVIRESIAYKNLMAYLREKRMLPFDSPLWTELENVVLKASPGFIEVLGLLTNGKLTEEELHTAILIKCHITPTQMTILLSRSKGTISQRRMILGSKIFEKKVSVANVDMLIKKL